MAPHRSLEPTGHRAASLGWREDTREPPACRGRVPPVSGGTSCSQPPLLVPLLPGSSPDLQPPHPGRDGLVSPAARTLPWLAWAATSSRWYLGRAGRSPTLGLPRQHAGVHTGCFSTRSLTRSCGSLSVGRTLPSPLLLPLGLKATASSKPPSPVPRAFVIGETQI